MRNPEICSKPRSQDQQKRWDMERGIFMFSNTKGKESQFVRFFKVAFLEAEQRREHPLNELVSHGSGGKVMDATVH